MSFYISQHAAEKLQQRKIPENLLDAVLQNPQQIIDDSDGAKIYQSQVLFPNGKLYLLRAIVYERTQPAIVATIYKTTQISRYWRSE